MDKKTQKIGVICSIVQIILSIICLIYNAINQENIIIWVLFLCSGILLLSSNISRNNKKEDEWGSATSSLPTCPLREEKSFSQRAFSIYTDIRKLQDKAKTSYTLITEEVEVLIWVTV